MKKPLMLLLTDIHLTDRNIEEVISIVNQAFKKAKSLKLRTIYVLGDIFDSRKSQTLKVLEAWKTILHTAKLEFIELRVIPGNHDKPLYHKEESYLDLYEDHPSMKLIRGYYAFEEGEYMVHMIPFFDEKKVYPEYLARAVAATQLLPDFKHILLTHIAVDGVRNNDGSEIEGTLSESSFDCFEKVFIGHYHDYQEVGNNIIYIGAIRQKNFGEDDKKGFTVFYDDGTYELIKSEFKQFKTVRIDLNTSTEKEINQLIEESKFDEGHVRFKLTGSKEKIKSIDKSKFESVGIDVKFDEDDINVNLDYTEIKSFTGFDKNSIMNEWKSFGENNEINEEISIQGSELLTNIFKK